MESAWNVSPFGGIRQVWIYPGKEVWKLGSRVEVFKVGESLVPSRARVRAVGGLRTKEAGDRSRPRADTESVAPPHCGEVGWGKRLVKGGSQKLVSF